MDEEMRRVTMRFFKARKHFDYRGMKNKLKKSYTHLHRVEDIWICCRTKEVIRSLDYCRLIVDQNENLNLLDMPEDLEDDGIVLDPTYEKNNVADSPLPLIQWYQKVNTSIRAKF